MPALNAKRTLAREISMSGSDTLLPVKSPEVQSRVAKYSSHSTQLPTDNSSAKTAVGTYSRLGPLCIGYRT